MGSFFWAPFKGTIGLYNRVPFEGSSKGGSWAFGFWGFRVKGFGV